MSQGKVWVVAWDDGDETLLWRDEKYDKDGSLIKYGKIKTFPTKNQCEKFRLKNTELTTAGFHTYCLEITRKQLEEAGDEGILERR